MSAEMPPGAGFFRVEIRAPGDPAVWELYRSRMIEFMDKMVHSEFSAGLQNLPSVRVDQRDNEYAELVLEWVQLPAENLWAAALNIVEDIVKIMSPDLLIKPGGFQVRVEREGLGFSGPL